MVKATLSNVKPETKANRKRRIYLENGITTDESGHILAPHFGFIPELLVDGNDKIGKGIFHFSTLPTNKIFTVNVNGEMITERGTCPTHCGEWREIKRGKRKGEKVFVSTCYATKGNFERYETARISLIIKTWLIRHALDFVVRAIKSQIEIYNIKAIRVHASGDFDSMEYVNAWREIATAFPAVVFWTYTKVKEAESAFDDIPNFNVVKSVISGYGNNYGHCDYILTLYEYLKSIGKKVYICRCGIDKNQHCNNCKACSECDFVLFLEHSTGYKAEKDPLFPIVKALIESQSREWLESPIAAD